MIYDEVMKTQNEIDSAIHSCKMDFITLNSKEKATLCSQLAKVLTPLLTEHGFLKKKNCFFRIHGDGLLQIVGVQQEAGIVGVYSYIYPLYEVTYDILNKGSLLHNLIGLSSAERHFVTFARSSQAIANMNKGRPFLLYQLDYDLPMKAEYMLLEERIIPLLDRCITGADAISFNVDPRWSTPKYMSWHLNNYYAFSFHLRDRRYSECASQVDDLIESSRSAIDYFQNKVASENSQEEDQLFLEDAKFELSLFCKLKSAIEHGDERLINQAMNDATISVYGYLNKLNKDLCKNYPIEKYLL